MRTAALPTFRKLYRIIHKKPNMTPTLPLGQYILEVTYSILLRKIAVNHNMEVHGRHIGLY